MRLNNWATAPGQESCNCQEHFQFFFCKNNLVGLLLDAFGSRWTRIRKKVKVETKISNWYFTPPIINATIWSTRHLIFSTKWADTEHVFGMSGFQRAICLGSVFYRQSIVGIEPGTAGWEAWSLPLWFVISHWLFKVGTVLMAQFQSRLIVVELFFWGNSENFCQN